MLFHISQFSININSLSTSFVSDRKTHFVGIGPRTCALTCLCVLCVSCVYACLSNVYRLNWGVSPCSRCKSWSRMIAHRLCSFILGPNHTTLVASSGSADSLFKCLPCCGLLLAGCKWIHTLLCCHYFFPKPYLPSFILTKQIASVSADSHNQKQI